MEEAGSVWNSMEARAGEAAAAQIKNPFFPRGVAEGCSDARPAVQWKNGGIGRRHRGALKTRLALIDPLLRLLGLNCWILSNHWEGNFVIKSSRKITIPF